MTDPLNVPGTPVSPVVNVSLPYVTNTEGIYQSVQMPATLDPPLNADGTYPTFTLVVDGSIASSPVYHFEDPSIVFNPGVSSVNDLTTLAKVKSWLLIPQDNTKDDSDIQDVITGWSTYCLGQLGFTSMTKVQQYTELRNGNGNCQMFVRNRPIINVESVTVNGVAVPAAGDWPSMGYYVSDDQKSIMIRGVGVQRGILAGYGSLGTYSTGSATSAGGFARGVGNVKLVYNAGFVRVPADLELAARKACAIHYKRKQTIDLASKAQAAGGTTGTTRYRDWDIPPEVETVIDYYSRVAVI
jgi:hypothetical protein